MAHAMRTHAYRPGSVIYDAVGATRTFPTTPYPSTHNLGNQPDERESARRRGQQVESDARHGKPVHLRRQPVHPGRRGEPRQADYIAQQMGQNAI